MFQTGDPAPDFTLQSDTDTAVNLADFRGRRVILFFFPKADTPGCTTQACGFRDSFPTIEAGNATVLGISPDPPAALAKWKAKESLPYTLLSDPDHAVAEAYGVWGEKKMYGKSYMGIIRSHFVIDENGRFADVQVKVSPKDSVERAVKAIG
ncbi:MAG: thioredoxin-dependent thiol peroxidase [Anaerolineales bacterium]|nr:thioredoxin-dependent thiol peroxidase [Anaerolineales bacterium]